MNSAGKLVLWAYLLVSRLINNRWIKGSKLRKRGRWNSVTFTTCNVQRSSDSWMSKMWVERKVKARARARERENDINWNWNHDPCYFSSSLSRWINHLNGSTRSGNCITPTVATNFRLDVRKLYHPSHQVSFTTKTSLLPQLPASHVLILIVLQL